VTVSPLAQIALVAWFAWWVAAHAATWATLVATVAQWRRVRRHGEPARWPGIAILRPCEGDEAGLEEQLASSLCPYPGPRRVLLLVPSFGDAARAACERVRARAPDEVQVLVTSPPPGTRNRKSAQLQVALDHLAAAPGGMPEVIVQADSDVIIDERALRSVIAALGEQERTAASFAAPIESDGRTLGDFAAAGVITASNHDLFSLSALARMTHGVVALGGALAAHRSRILVETGGFASLEGLLGEDFEIGRRLAAAGYAVAVAEAPVMCADEGRTLGDVVDRSTRWAMVVRQQRPGMIFTYPLLLAATPPLLVTSIVLALTVRWGFFAPLHVLWLIGARTLLAVVTRRIHGLPSTVGRAMALMLAAETLLIVAAARAAFSNRVVWRGRRLRIERGGRIVIEGEVPAAAAR
jgi:ceramide glucosyltransferase